MIEASLQTDFIEHLTDIEMIKERRQTDNDRKRAEKKQQEYNDIDWENRLCINDA